jgi:hypothetical protein
VHELVTDDGAEPVDYVFLEVDPEGSRSDPLRNQGQQAPLREDSFSLAG